MRKFLAKVFVGTVLFPLLVFHLIFWTPIAALTLWFISLFDEVAPYHYRELCFPLVHAWIYAVRNVK